MYSLFVKEINGVPRQRIIAELRAVIRADIILMEKPDAEITKG